MQWAVELVSEVDSTNRELLERARSGAPAGSVLVADHQTAGHGRLDRSWEAPPGSSLLVSVLLRPDVSVDKAFALTMAAGLAGIDACAAVGCHALLKWPNDLLLGDPPMKVGGILAESVVRSGRLDAVVIGMGLNLNWPRPMPGGLATIATSLNHHTDHVVDRDELLQGWLDHLGERLESLPSALRRDYRAVCSTLGRRVLVSRPGGDLEGLATDVDEDGSLLVRDPAGREVTVTVGDVVHVRLD